MQHTSQPESVGKSTFVSEQKDLSQNTVVHPLIYVCAPARTCVTGDALNEIDHARIDKAYGVMRRLGWDVKEAANVRRLDHGFAGSDRERADGVTAGFADSQVDLVMGLRGGYGTARILPYLDWETIGKSQAVFAGLSDLTALNLALYARCGKASWQGPVASSFARDNAVFNEAFMRAMKEDVFRLKCDVAVYGSLKRNAFDASGLLWGGNLTILLSLLGTPWFPAVEGGILVVEDVFVTAWRFERMLLQLAQSGVLARQKALVVGDVAGHAAGLGGDNSGVRLADALNYIADVAGIPVVQGLAFGHRDDTLTLPVGVQARVGLEGGALTLEVEHPPVPADYPGAQSARAPLWWV